LGCQVCHSARTGYPPVSGVTDSEVDAALTATEAGRRTFEKLGFQHTGYRELFVRRGTSKDGEDQQEVEMVCCFPGDEAEIQRTVGQGVVLSTSEMVVRYET